VGRPPRICLSGNAIEIGTQRTLSLQEKIGKGVECMVEWVGERRKNVLGLQTAWGAPGIVCVGLTLETAVCVGLTLESAVCIGITLERAFCRENNIRERSLYRINIRESSLYRE
jgi:hypothetical protein